MTLSAYGLSESPSLTSGDPAPEVEIELIDGSVISIDEFRGRYLFLNFWATWCSPCLGEMPQLHAANQRFRSPGLEMVSLSVDDEVAAVQRWREGHWKMPWHNALVKDANSGVLDAFKVNRFPTNILVGPDGSVIASGNLTVGDRLLETLEEQVGTE